MTFTTLILILSINVNNKCFYEGVGIGVKENRLVIVSKTGKIDLDIHFEKIVGEHSVYTDNLGNLYSVKGLGIDLTNLESKEGKFIIFINQVSFQEGKYRSLRGWIVSTNKCENRRVEKVKPITKLE